MVVCVLPGGKGAHMDDKGKQALGILRALGLPSLVLAVQVPTGASLKERAAAKKAAASEFASQVLFNSSCFYIPLLFFAPPFLMFFCGGGGENSRHQELRSFLRW